MFLNSVNLVLLLSRNSSQFTTFCQLIYPWFGKQLSLELKEHPVLLKGFLLLNKWK